MAMPKQDIKYFISYAHDDGPFFDLFKKGVTRHLKTSSVYNFISWDDSEIPAGSSWNDVIQQNLGEAKMAILCVSTSFLNSNYIQASEFAVLKNRFPGTVIVPVYFNHCNFQVWEDLSNIQFFKPGGGNYGKGDATFAFCDLVKFGSNNAVIPDSATERYFEDLRGAVENALRAAYPVAFAEPVTGAATAIPAAVSIEKKQVSLKEGNTDKLVKTILVTFMALSALLIFYTLLFHQFNTETAYKSSIGCIMFFGGGALYIVNGKNKNKVIS